MHEYQSRRQQRRTQPSGSKTGTKTVYIGKPAIATLPWLFSNPGIKPGWPPHRPAAVLAASPRPPGSPGIHDLRHTFASAAVTAGQGLPIIGKLLGHTQVATTAPYAHLAADPVKAAADHVSSEIAKSIVAELDKAAEKVAMVR